MKIKPEHYQYLKESIEALLAKHPNAINDYENGRFKYSEKTKDLQTRFNNDLLYSAVSSKWVCDNLYPYMNDTHIETALRNICPKVERKY